MKKIILILLAFSLFSCSHRSDLAKEENSLILPPEFELVPDLSSDKPATQKNDTQKPDQKDLQKLKETLLK